MSKAELPSVRLSLTGEDHDIVDTFSHTFCKTNDFVRAPLLNTGVDGEIQSCVSETQGIIVIIEARQIADWMMKWLLTVCHKPILLFAACTSNKGKSKIRQSSVLMEMRAALRSSGISSVRIELLNYDPELLTFEKPDEVYGLLQTFSRATSHFNDVPKVIFCSTPDEVEEYSDYCKRIKEEAERFTHLRNFFDVDGVVQVQKVNDGWQFNEICFSSSRLELTDTELKSQVNKDLKGAPVCDSLGLLMPIQVQMVLAESLNKWLLSKKIGAICDLKLTLKCPDEETRFSIQQSPITI